MSDAWMPGVGHLRAAAAGGHLKGGAPRAVWQALGADPAVVSARSAAERLSDLGRACHLSWNPLSGEIIQMISILRAGCGLGGPEGLTQPALGRAADSGARDRGGEGRRPEDRGAQDRRAQDRGRQDRGGHDRGAKAGAAEPGTDGVAGVNSEGRFCVQICVVAFAWDPFTAGPMAGLRDIMAWLDSWGIPRRWPAGRPAAYPHGHAGRRSRRLWASGGHFGASQVPGWLAAGPGEIDIERLTGTESASVIGIQSSGTHTVPEGSDRERSVRERSDRERSQRERERSERERERSERERELERSEREREWSQRELERSQRERSGQELGDQDRGGRDREQDERQLGKRTGLADLDDIFEGPVPAAGSLSRVG